MTVTVTGNDTTAARGTEDKSNDTETIRVINVPVPVAPGIPGSPRRSGRTGSSLSLTCDAPSSGGAPSRYRWRYSTDSDVADSDPKVTSTGPAVTISGLEPGTDYWIDVRAENSAGQSDYTSDTATSTLPVAVAPTVRIAPVDSVEEGRTRTLTASVSGGTYDGDPVYTWEVVTEGGGEIPDPQGESVTYRAPSVTASTDVVVKVTVTVTGNDTTAARGTEDKSNDTEAFRVVCSVEAPTVTIGAVTSVDEGETQLLSTMISGGCYDELDYEWEVDTQRGGTISGRGASATYTPPDVSERTRVTVRVNVTARGTGIEATPGTSDSTYATESFYVLCLAEAPAVTIGSVTSVDEDQTQSLSTSVIGGCYDELDYEWEVVTEGGGTISGSGPSATYTPPNVSVNTNVTVRVTVTAEGTGTKSVNGSSDTSDDSEAFIVIVVPELNLTGRDIDAISRGVARAGVRINRDGTVDQYVNVRYQQISSATDWIVPRSSSVGDDYEVRFQGVEDSDVRGAQFSGTVGTDGDSGWLALSSSRLAYYYAVNGSEAIASATLTVSIRRTGSTVVLASTDYSLFVENFEIDP